jgi:hypothetical protein
LRGALISAHVLLAARGAAFVSMLDPPDPAKHIVAQCVNERVFPVLVGQPDPGKQTAAQVLISPIILYDFPTIATASRGHTFDATEIDELLLLSVASLGDGEKREAERSHPYVRDLIERAEKLDAEQQAQMHGELRIDGVRVQPGSRVRVHPRGHADIWDDVIAGKVGRVCSVHEDFEGKQYVGVVFDDDPASDMHEWYGRAFFYGPDEIEVCPLDEAPQVR